MYSNEYCVYLHANIDIVYETLKDINQYSQIMPYIKKIEILESIESKIKTYVKLEHLLIKLDYYCHIEFNNKYQVNIIGYDGSFKYINATWQLEKITGNKTKVFYKLEFELKSKIQQKIAEKIFGIYQVKLNKKLVDYINNLKI